MNFGDQRSAYFQVLLVGSPSNPQSLILMVHFLSANMFKIYLGVPRHIGMVVVIRNRHLVSYIDLSSYLNIDQELLTMSHPMSS